jgi:hypothetical protein
MRRVDEAFEAFAEPMIASRLAPIRVHALLHDDPAPVVADDEAVQVKFESILHRGAVDLRDQAARMAEAGSVESGALAYRQQFRRRGAAMPAASSADMDAALARARGEAALEGPEHARGDTRGMPVHARDRAEALEPEGMREAAEQLVPAIFDYDGIDEDRAEPGHPLAEPGRHATAVQRQIRTPRAPAYHRWSRRQASARAARSRRAAGYIAVVIAQWERIVNIDPWRERLARRRQGRGATRTPVAPGPASLAVGNVRAGNSPSYPDTCDGSIS